MKKKLKKTTQKISNSLCQCVSHCVSKPIWKFSRYSAFHQNRMTEALCLNSEYIELSVHRPRSIGKLNNSARVALGDIKRERFLLPAKTIIIFIISKHHSKLLTLAHHRKVRRPFYVEGRLYYNILLYFSYSAGFFRLSYIKKNIY